MIDYSSVVYVFAATGDGGRELVTLPGGHTGIPGLVVTPEWSPAGRRFTGGWWVVHRRSGQVAAGPYPLPGVAYEVAAELGHLGTDWRYEIKDMTRIQEELARIEARRKVVPLKPAC